VLLDLGEIPVLDCLYLMGMVAEPGHSSTGRSAHGQKKSRDSARDTGKETRVEGNDSVWGWQSSVNTANNMTKCI
jgi:hypothetical protein